MEMRFPVVQCYAFALRKNLIRCDMDGMPVLGIEPTGNRPRRLCGRPCNPFDSGNRPGRGLVGRSTCTARDAHVPLPEAEAGASARARAPAPRSAANCTNLSQADSHHRLFYPHEYHIWAAIVRTILCHTH